MNNLDEKIRRDYEKTAKCFIEARPGVDHNTTRARTSLCPVQTNVYTTTAVIIGALWAKSELKK